MALPFLFFYHQHHFNISKMPKKLTQEEFIQRAKAKHGDKYDYSKVEYKDTLSKVCIICLKHGEFWQIAGSHIHSRGKGCPMCGLDVHRKPLYGIGVLDIIGDNGTKPYQIWASVLQRCYDEKHLNKNPSYKDCSVSSEWHLFSNFKRWFENPENGYMEGYHLDKDILVKGNKVYSPETCCFVPREINLMLIKDKNRRNGLPVGVSLIKNKYFNARLSACKNIYLGLYNTPEEAFNVYKRAKEAHIQEVATKYFNEGKITEKVYNALMKYEVEITD